MRQVRGEKEKKREGGGREREMEGAKETAILYA